MEQPSKWDVTEIENKILQYLYQYGQEENDERYRTLVLRVPFAAVFIYHGLGKFPALSQTAAMLQLPEFLVVIVGIAEVLAGVGAIAGGLKIKQADLVNLLTGIATIPVLVGAIAMVHWPRWSFVPSESHPMGGMEFQVVLLGVALYFLLIGIKKA